MTSLASIALQYKSRFPLFWQTRKVRQIRKCLECQGIGLVCTKYNKKIFHCDSKASDTQTIYIGRFCRPILWVMCHAKSANFCRPNRTSSIYILAIQRADWSSAMLILWDDENWLVCHAKSVNFLVSRHQIGQQV